MNKYFSLDGKIFQTLSALYQLIVLNMITLLFCLPIVTIGGSLSAAFSVLFAIEEQKEVPVFKLFWNHFKANFKNSSILGLLMTTLFIIEGLLIYFFGNSIFGFLWLILLAFTLIIALTCLLTLGHLSQGLKQTVSVSLFLNLKYTGYYCLGFSVFAIWFLIPIFLPLTFFLWFFFSLSVPMLLMIKIYQFTYTNFYEKLEEGDQTK